MRNKSGGRTIYEYQFMYCGSTTFVFHRICVLSVSVETATLIHVFRAYLGLIEVSCVTLLSLLQERASARSTNRVFYLVREYFMEH